MPIKMLHKFTNLRLAAETQASSRVSQRFRNNLMPTNQTTTNERTTGPVSLTCSCRCRSLISSRCRSYSDDSDSRFFTGATDDAPSTHVVDWPLCFTRQTSHRSKVSTRQTDVGLWSLSISAFLFFFHFTFDSQRRHTQRREGEGAVSSPEQLEFRPRIHETLLNNSCSCYLFIHDSVTIQGHKRAIELHAN
jgi:hypothetical protein